MLYYLGWYYLASNGMLRALGSAFRGLNLQQALATAAVAGAGSGASRHGPPSFSSSSSGSSSSSSDSESSSSSSSSPPEPHPGPSPLRLMLAFGLPALCDAAGSTLLNVGLFYTQASTYQMLRGSQVLFAGILTTLLLRRRLQGHHWAGMGLVTLGAAVCGYASMLSSAATAGGGPSPGPSPSPGPPPLPSPPGWAASASSLRLPFDELLPVTLAAAGRLAAASPGASLVLLGDLLVVVAQLCSATQFVVEEKFLAQYRVPAALAVGMEGLWGIALCALALPTLGALPTGPLGRPFDSAADALSQASSSPPLAGALLLGVACIGFFNFCGVSITKALSGASRATIDATRTMFVWAGAVALGWELLAAPQLLQLLGFALLLAGSALYNELVRVGSGGGPVFAAFQAPAANVNSAAKMAMRPGAPRSAN